MPFDDALRERKTEAHASAVAGAGLIEASKPLEYPVAIGQRDARAVVIDDEAHRTFIGGQRQLNAAMSEARRIVDEVADDSRQLVSPTRRRRPRRWATR